METGLKIPTLTEVIFYILWYGLLSVLTATVLTVLTLCAASVLMLLT